MMVPEVVRDLYTTQERAIWEEGERVLQMATSLLPLDGGPVSKFIEVGKPIDVILSIAKQERIDLIVVGALRELMLGSVSHRVVTHAASSVLVVGSEGMEVDGARTLSSVRSGLCRRVQW
jgi:nucleotide-binding universal stress UspA family protein